MFTIYRNNRTKKLKYFFLPYEKRRLDKLRVDNASHYSICYAIPVFAALKPYLPFLF